MTEPITIRAGDLGPEHIGWRYRGSLIKDVGVVLSTDTGQRWIHPEIEVTLSPPAPIRRRITWADLRDVPPRDWDGATVVDGSDHPRLNTIKSWASFFDDDSITTVVIEVPVGHPLATCGEPA